MSMLDKKLAWVFVWALAACGDPDRDGDGHLASVDCDDENADIHFGAAEVCDGVDNDCDGALDGADLDVQSDLVRYRDFDGDGHGDAASPFAACSDADGGSTTADDCDDRSEKRAPGMAEVCDGLDNDCDGLTDDADPGVDPATFTPYHRDLDLDGFGDPFATFPSCAGGLGRTLDASDCDDGDATIFPGAQEVCDGVDNDCDLLTDDFDPSVDVATGVPVYLDSDGDGHGDPTIYELGCAAPPNASLLGDDCNDNRIHVYPGHPEMCDGVDNDCDLLVDDRDPDVDLSLGSMWYADSDSDGYGDPAYGELLCSPRPGSVGNADDCDDGNGTIHPGIAEVCDGIDNDCDALPDSYDTDLVGGDTYYADTDLDGFGDINAPTPSCGPIPGKTLTTGDCNDHSSTAFPGANEICDQDDNDCDTLVDDDDPSVDAATMRTFWYDGDYDGAGVDGTEVTACTMPFGYAPVGGDCDDADDLNSPIGREDCDGQDNTCDGLVDDEDPDLYVAQLLWEDADGDGFGNPDAPFSSCGDPGPGYVPNLLDCNDADADIKPGDNDGDGYDACVAEGRLDCNDEDPNIHPFASEPCNGVDDDCDGHPDNLSGEGDTVALGCDLCPGIDEYDPTMIAYETYNPCVLDPNVQNLCSDNPYYPDTHIQGNRLHKVVYRTDISVYRDKLFLFFPPGKGLNNKNITKWAAHVGYKVINLGFDNELKFSIACEDYAGDCSGLLEETHVGTDAISLVEIGPADSITGRLQTLLAFLDYTYPTMGWGTHLNVDGTVNWSTIVVTGWSNGSGAAAYATRDVQAAGGIVWSGPEDWVAPGVLHPWLTDFTWQTPGCANYAIYHAHEPDMPIDLWELPWTEMGIPGPNADLVEARYPWNDSHILTTTTLHMGADHCTAHKAVAFDQCMDVAALGQPYLDLFCAVGDAVPIDPFTCEE